MRMIVIKDEVLVDANDQKPVECWHNSSRNCTARCAAQHVVVSQSPQGENTMYVCAAMPQQFPIGIPEPSRLVVPSPLIKG